MEDQKPWGPAEKKEFLRFLKSGKGASASGEVKEGLDLGGRRGRPHKARFVALELATDTLFTFGNGQAERADATRVGFKATLGKHVFSWVRLYAGVAYAPTVQRRLDGTDARLKHLQVPVGVELALVPLGTPHTRYLLQRGGIAAHSVTGDAAQSEFRAPVLGTHLAWTAGLGYEWQIADTGWRLRALLEGYRGVSRDAGAGFYGAGLTAGFAYTF